MTKLFPKDSKPFTWGSLFLLLFVSTSFLILAFSSCSKPAGKIGVIINPDQSQLELEWNDTTTVYAYSSPDDSVRSDNLSVNVLGSRLDPVFGHTQAGFYVQPALSAFEHPFDESSVVDSVVLQLLYTGDSYGDTNTTLLLHTYQVEEDFLVDNMYYSNLDLQVGEIDFANFSFVPRPNDSVVIEGDTLEAILRVPLNNSPELGEYLLNAPAEAMADNENFLQYFKGIYVVPAVVNEGGSMLYFDLVPNKSRMTLYYTDTTAKRFEYLITSSSARVGKYTHNFETGSPEFRQQVVDGDTSLGQQQFYVHGLGGVNSTIKLPSIDEWRKQGPIALNEAKLILTGVEEREYGPPPQLALFSITDDGGRALLQDITEGEAFFGGFYQSSTNSYTFRITLYLQQLISDTTINNNGLSLYINNPWLSPQSFIFNGNEPVADTAVRLKLEMLYTKLN
jgi:hypothetical protein